jgi:PKD repeat protein
MYIRLAKIYSMKTLLFAFLLIGTYSFAQTTIWSDDFENPALWTLNQSTGVNDLDANMWFITDAEGGVAAGQCGVATNGNKTLHVGCQGTWCIGSGATYNAGDGGLGFFASTTNKRTVYNSNISTLGNTNLTLSFDWIGIGAAGTDYGSVVYSINGGTTWTTLQAMTGGTTCGNGQGLWQASNITLPVACNNIANLRIGFNWTNDNDGAGTDPSFALNNVRITIPGATPPEANFISNISTLCPGECVTFSDQSTGNVSTWAWDFGDGTTSALQTPPVHCFANPGNYTVTLTVGNSGGTSSHTMNITVAPLPSVGTSLTNSTIIALQSFATYQWVECPALTLIPNANDMMYTATNNGAYAVIVTSPQGCTDTSACVNISGLGIDEGQHVGFELHPMPFTSDLYISGLGTEPVTLTIFSIDGRAVYVDPKGSNGSIALNIPSGQYILSVTSSEGTTLRRIIRE